MIIGQDEAIYKQYQFRAGRWTTPTGKAAILPKDEGAGVMISAFQCRELGILRIEDISAEDLVRINMYRRKSHYQDKEAAVKVNKLSTKPALSESPFIVRFNYGANEDGYWTYDHMFLQLEDCVDVIKVLYPDFDIMFIVDHSCGHDRQRPDGLRVANVNKEFGGAQPCMRDTLIEQADGFLGPHERSLEPGTTQTLVYPMNCPDNLGPYWMTLAERKARRNDRLHPTKTEKKVRDKIRLSSCLTTAGIKHDPPMNFNEMTKIAKSNGVEASDVLPKFIEGWLGKAKGAMQILAERGFID